MTNLLIKPTCHGLLAVLALSACQQQPELKSLQRLSTTMIEAGTGTAAKSAQRNVVPTKPAPEPLQLRIEDERYLGDVARQLGVTVDAMLEWNQLGDTLLKPGQFLAVRTTKELLDRFVERRERRKAARIAAEEAKRQDKLRKEAEARAAKRAKQVALRARKHGVAVAESGKPGVAEPTGVPLRPGESRRLGAGGVRGVSLPAGLLGSQ